MATKQVKRVRWATVDPCCQGTREVEMSSEEWCRTSGEHCVGCGKADTLWEPTPHDSGVRLCTGCGTLTQFREPPKPAEHHWLVILRQLQKVDRS